MSVYGGLDPDRLRKALNSDPVGLYGGVDYDRLAQAIFESHFARKPFDALVFKDENGNAVAVDGKGRKIAGPSKDHAEVIQAAFDNVPDNGVVYFAAATGGRGGVDLATMYLIEKPITVTKGVKIVGAGRNKVYLRPKSTFPDGQPLLKIAPTKKQYLFEMEGMKFHNADETGTTKNTWVEIGGSYAEVNIFRCEFRMDLHLYQTDRWNSIVETWFYGASLRLYSRLEHLRVVGCIFDGGGIRGYDVFNTYYGVNRLVVVGNRFTNSTISISTSRASIVGNVFETGYVRLVPEAKYVAIVGNTFYNARYRTIRTWGKVAGDVDTVLIAANTFYGNGADAKVISLENQGSDKVYIFDNVFVNVPKPAIAWAATYSPVIRRNIGFRTEESGTATFSGDGATTDFVIATHSLDVQITDPSKVVVKCTPASPDAVAAAPVTCYLSDEDADGVYESIRARFASAPAAGTDNVVIAWEAEYIG